MKNKIYKLLSIVLAIMVVFSCCSVAFTAFAEETITATYYVSETGSDETGDGLTPDTAVASVAKAVELANTQYGEGQTVAVAITAASTGVSLGTLPTYTYDLIVMGAESTPAIIALEASGIALANSETSTTSYKNITLSNTTNYVSYYLNNSKGVVLNSDFSGLGGNKYLELGNGTDGGAAKSVAGQNIVLNTSVGIFYLGNSGWQSKTFTEDVNITINNSNAGPTFYLNPAANSYVKYEKNLNFNFKSASSIKFNQPADATKGYYGDTRIDGALQIINSTGKTITDSAIAAAEGYEATTALGSIKGKAVVDGESTTYAPLEKWILTNQNTEYKNAISFTETAGLYDVAESYTVVATKVGDSSVVVTSAAAEGSQDVMLDLREYGAGEYNLAITKQPETFTYYIASEADGGLATNDGLSANAPLVTVNQVITAANLNENITNADIIEVKIVGAATADNAASWGTDIACNAGKIIITSNDAATPSYVYGPSGAVDASLGGEVVYDNVKLMGISASGNPNRIIANGRSVTINSNVTMYNTNYEFYTVYQTRTVNYPITNTFKNAYMKSISVAHWNNNGITYNEDLTYIIDNAAATPSFKFSTSYDSASATKVKKNLNFVIYDASSVTFGAKASKTNSYYNISGAVQVINPSDVTVDLTNLTIIGKDDTAPAGGIYHIIDDTGIHYGVEFVPEFEAGKYKINVDRDMYNVFVTPEGGEKTAINGDYLVVDEPGTYTVTKERKSGLTATYYISAQGSDDNDGLTADKPFLTLKKAVDAANEKGYVAGDTVYVKTIGADAIDTGLGTRERLPAYGYKLVITANDTSVKGKIAGVFQIYGETEFTYVTVATAMAFGGQNVTFGEGASLTSSNATYIGQNTNTYSLNAPGPVNVKISTYANAGFYFCGSYHNYATYNYPITVEIDKFNPYYNDMVYGGFYLSSTNCVSTLNAPVNVKINSAASNLIPFRATDSKVTYGEDFAFQFINASDKPLGKTGDTAKRNDSTTGTVTSALDTMPEGSVYVITNTTGNDDLVTFTPSVGTYEISGIDNDTQFVRATSVADASVYFDSVDGYLTVDPGEYTISIEKRTGLQITYFVGGADASDETGDGTEAKPFATVTKALATATAKGYANGNTITVKLLGNVTWGTATEAVRDYQAVIDSDLETAPTIDFEGKDIIIGGDLEFKNVKNSYGGDGWRGFCFRGGDVTFSSKTATPSYSISFGWSAAYNEDTPVAGQNVVFNNSVTAAYIKIAHASNGILHYTDDLNVVINNKDASPKFGFEPDYNNSTKLDSGVCANFYVKKAYAITIGDVSGNNSGTAKLDGAIQILVDDSTTRITDDTKTYLNETLKPAEGVYIIRNNTGIEGLLSTVKNSRGVYAIDLSKLDTTRYNLMINGEAANVVDGYITVPAQGEYEFTLTTNAMSKEFYVQNGATEGDGTADAPFATVAEAINAANALNLTAGDVVTIKIMGETAAEWGTGAEAYTFELNVVSNDAANKSTVVANQTLTGDVTFDDINIVSTRSNSSNPYRIYAAGYDVTLGTNATMSDWFEIVTAKQSATHTTQNIVINVPYSQYVLIGNSNAGYLKYTGDVNVVINNANAAPGLEFLGHYGGNVTLQANLNVNVKDAKSFAVASTSKSGDGGDIQAAVASVNGAAQLIIPGYTTISDTSIANFKSLNSENYYIVRNNSGEELEFTATAGIYTVSGSDTIYAYKDGVAVAESVAGSLDLSALGAGEYVLVKTRDAQVFNYTNADGATIADMISKAISNGAIEGDTLKITLTGTTAIPYGTPVEYLFDVEIISSESTPVSFVSQDILKGDTKFDGVTVSYPGGENTLWLGGHNVEMTAATTISGGYYIGLGAYNTYLTLEEQTVKFDCAMPLYLTLAGDWANITRTGALNITIGHPTTKPIISFGFHGTNTYADVNINLGKTTDTSFKYIGDGSHVFTGSLNIIGENPIKDTTYLDGLTATVYTIYNKTGVEGILGFGTEGGKFTVSGDKVVRAISANAYTDSVDGVITLETEGNYYIGIPSDYSGDVDTYNEYIVDRTALNGKHALNNVAAKIQNGEALNVVYYGGSVTAGSGASISDKTSWRGLIGSWLEINAPGSKVTNVNSAIGGTGSYFGYYRLDEAVIAHQPDLLFIEFSINDYYDNQDLWNIGEDQAAAQFEAIVRKVRTELPNCDIVTVLTTDRDQISNLQNSDTLHAQARGHDKIAAKYGIPSLRVGHALADHLATTGETWADYVTDLVHPNDNGYRIYANVVEEYFAESLLGTKNENAILTPHIVPENIVSDKIWAGDVSFIQCDEDLSAESASLGGSEFAVSGGRSYPYHAKTFRMSDTEAVLKFKFTGTELSILEDQYSNSYKGVNVKIDGGEEQYYAFRGYRPTVIASGLENVEHTAEIRIAEVAEGGGHWVYGFFVRNEAQDLVKPAMEGTYYVSAEGDDEANTGLTAESPLKTVKAAIQKAKDDGFGARDKVYIKVIGTTAVDFGTDNNTMPTHGFKLHVSSYTSGATVGINDGTIKLGGHTDFENITIHVATYSTYASLIYNDYDVNFLQGTTLKNINVSTFVLGTSDVNNTITRPTNVTFDGAVVSTSDKLAVKLSNDWNYKTYNAPINVTFNNSAIKTNVYFGASNGVTTYNSAVNINIENASSVSLVKANQNPIFGEYAAVQVINSAGATLAIADEVATALGDNYWVLNNNSGNKELFSFTDVIGKYTVNVDTTMYTVVATSEDGTKSATANNGVLDLTALGADTYNITVTKIPAYKTYYVQTGATEGDGSLLKPFANVMEAVTAAKTAGYTMNDEVTVMLLGSEAVEWGTGVNYDFKLVVDSTEKLTVNNATNMTGDVKFDNVTVANAIVAYGYNLEITANTSYNKSINGHVQEKSVNETQTIIIGNAYTGGLHTGSGNYGGITWKEDVNYIFTDANAYPTISFTAYYGGTNNFNKNFNLILKDARGIAINATSKSDTNGTFKAVVKGVVNFLIPADATISEGSVNNLFSLSENVYYLENALGNAGTIDYVSGSAGEYVINVDRTKYDVYLTDEEGNTSSVAGADVKLPAAGKYTLNAVRKAATVVYYAQAGGTGDGSSAESPLGSVNAVIAKAIADDCNYSSITVKLMVVGTDALPWDTEAITDLTKHNFTLQIDSETEGAKLGSSSTIHMGGNIIVDNVKLIISGNANSYPALGLNGYDATFGSNVTSDGGYWTFADGRNSAGITLNDDQHVTINSNLNAATYCLTNSMSASTYNADLYFTFNANGKMNTTFASQWGATAINGNVFIDIVNATSASFSTTAYEGGVSFGENAKVQVIDRAGLGISNATAGLANLDSTKLWVVTDETGENGTVSATGTPGVLAVDYDAETYTIKAVADDKSAIYVAQGNTLTIPAAGNYTVKVVRATVDSTIYVSADGSANASGAEDDPIDTVENAIKAAVAVGFGAEDTITIKLMGDAVETGTILAYEFDLIVTSASAKSKLVVTSDSIANEEDGQVRFSNVTISKAEDYKYVVLNDSNVVFESDVTFEFGYSTALAIGTYNDGGANKTVGGRDIVFNGTTPIISLSNNGWANRTYTDDVNLVINNASADARIRFNASYLDASNGTTVFDQKLNVNIKNAADVSFAMGEGVTVNGGLQIINSSAKTVKVTDAGIASVTGSKWVINNRLGADNIAFTETAGTFTVNYDAENYYLLVTNEATGEEAEYNAATLVLAEGTYTVEKVRIPREISYTLTADGEYPSVEAAILAANAAGYGEGDIVTFNISGDVAVPWGQTLTSPNRLTAYEYNLIIQTAEGQETKATVGESLKTVRLSGPTEFKNIHINVNGTKDSYPTFGMGGNDVTFNADVTFEGGYWGFVTGQYNNSLSVNKAMDLYVANSLGDIKIGNSYTGNNYNADVNITYNNANNSPTFTFGTNATEITNFKKNVNFNFLAARGVNFKKTGHTFAVGSAIQIINNCNVEVDSTTGVLDELVDTEGNPVPTYVLINKTDKVDAISFTETAGTFALDIGAIKYQGYYAVITNNATGEETLVNSDSVTLPAGEYTVTTRREGLQKEYNITSGTLADAVQVAIDEGYGYGDDVTFKLGTLTEINVGTLPKYNFNLVIESDVQTRLVMDTTREIANNQGAHTHFKNVEIYNAAQYSTINLAGSSATFDKDCKITTGGYPTLSFGTTADTKAVVLDSEQKVVLDCKAPNYISLSSWLYAAHTYNDDVTLVLNHPDTDTEIWFNAYSEGAVNGVTNYLGNININIKDAAGVRFKNYEGTAPGGDTKFQLLVNDSTNISQDTISEFNDYYAYGGMYYVIDKSFQRGILEFTDEAGVYEVNSEYGASAKHISTFSYDEYAFVETENGETLNVENGKVEVYNTEEFAFEDSGIDYYDIYTNVWEVRTDEYFEDFNCETLDEIEGDWKFSSDSSAVSDETEIVDGELNIVTQHNLKEIPALNQNKNLDSKEQYISMDMHGTGFYYYNGLEILARLDGANMMESYSFHISSPFIALTKLDGSKNAGGYYASSTTGFDTEGLWGRLPGTQGVNEYTFNSNHTYRISISITTDYEDGNEIAFVRGIVLNLNTNEVMFDETFKDTQPLQGTKFAFCSPSTGSDVYVDNLYFSSKSFRDGDEGILDGDINGDDVYDIRDLVYTEENAVDAFDAGILNKADKNVNGQIDTGDYAIIRKEILADTVIGDEFGRTGATDAEADAMREEILNTTSSIVTEGGKTYYTASNGIKEEITGDIYYVSSKATGTGNAGTQADPWTFAELQAQVKPDNSTTYKNRLVGEGDAVLFERGSVFRTNDLMRDESTSGQTSDCYAYLMMSEGTLYGAYGEGAKPKFIDSYKNYADETWSAVEGQENIWVIDAPEIVIDREGDERVANGKYNGDNSATNIVFNNGEKIGQRKAFPDSARNGGKVYTIFKDGQFTYDEINHKLYLCSEVNPNTYDSIEVSRALYAIQVNSHESNVVVDNLAFHGFAKGAVGSNYGSNYMSVTNCDIGYSGGTFMGNVRGGNAVGLWGGGAHIEVNYNWIYQTWDSAISPQGNKGFDYTGFQVIGNLLEYNNADIEIFDSGINPTTGIGAIWDDCVISDNLMRFTTLGWGSREADKIRGIQGVIRGGVTGASSVDIDWNNNTIDSPGMEIYRFNNTTSFTQEGEGEDATITTTGIFKFGTNGSTIDNNTYYFNPYVRNTSLVVREYMTAVPADYLAQYGEAESTGRSARTAAEFYNSMRAFDTGANSRFFWGGVQVTSGN